MKSGTSELTSIHGDGDGIFNAKTSSSSVAWSSSTGSSSQPAVYNFPAASAAVSAAQLSGSSMVALPYQSTSQRLNSSSAAMSAASAKAQDHLFDGLTLLFQALHARALLSQIHSIEHSLWQAPSEAACSQQP